MWKEQLRRLGDSLARELIAGVGISLVLLIRGLRRRLQTGKSVAQSLEVQTITGGMMEKEVVIGTEGKAEVKLANGKLYLIGKYDGVQVDADLTVGIEIDLFIDKLKAQIPGAIDDAILDVLKVALKVI